MVESAVLESRFGWVDGAPKFAARWTVKGRTPELQGCTVVFDLLTNRRSVVVYPGAVCEFAMVMRRDAVEMLATTLEDRECCAVPVDHISNGRRLLGLRPCSLAAEPSWMEWPAERGPYLGPMELSLELPRKSIRVLLLRDGICALADTLAEVLVALR